MKRRCAALLSLLLVACRDQPAPAPVPPEMPTAQTSDPTKQVLANAIDTLPEAGAFTPERITVTGGAMGTHLTFAACTTPTVNGDRIRKAFSDAIDELKRIQALMTTWTNDSEVSRINQAAGKAPVKVGDETYAIIKESVHAGDISEGTFDITFHTLHGLWKFDEDLDPHPPSDAAVKARLPFVSYKNIVLDEKEHSVFLKKKETQIGLGGIAKGYGVDMAVRVIEKAGIPSFFVQAGGDLFARGKKPDGSEWSAGVRDPRGPDGSFFAMIPLTDHAFSTAGDYERSYVIGDKRYHHIIDPRTGQPATACRSVTIWAPTALLADEIDDAVFILGPEKGMKLVESIDGVGAVIVDAKNSVHVSQRLRPAIRIVAAPTGGI